MNEFVLPSLLKKTITFKRLNNKNVYGYEIYGLFKDDNYASGIREELLDSFENLSEPNTSLTDIILEFNQKYTWQLPEDIYIDRDHKFKIYINNAIVSTLYYQYNKYNKMLTIDKNLKTINAGDTIKLQYFKDTITKTYMLEQDCQIKVKPIFRQTYSYGTHNIII